MGRTKIIAGKKYERIICGTSRVHALHKAKEYREQNVNDRHLHARVSPDPDHKGQYGVYIR
jgi:hypothetical protein